MGVNTSWMKLQAFAAGAFIAGGTGAIFASFQDSVFPNNFDFPQLVIIYCMVILGGLGNIFGVILGALILSILPEFLREYGAYRMMLFGLILIVLMALRPQGIMGEAGVFIKKIKRPDKKDKGETGILKSSTELYYANRPIIRRNEQKEKNFFKKADTVVLEINHITRSFGGITAVDQLSFKVYEKEILSIIGPNGAGKTTVFNLISGIYPPTSGNIIHKGIDITGFKPHQIVEGGIARTFQNLRLFNKMTVLDNARASQFCRTKANLLSILFHLPRHCQEETATEIKVTEVLSLFGARLTGYRLDQQAMFLSYANRRRLEMARALSTDAKLLLVDEPSAGMNPQETEEITDFIKQLRDIRGYTIVMIEHKLNVVKAISDRVIALDYGIKIADGSYEDVVKDKQVIEAYLGRKRH
jgi:branched-chain amino acid transport system permease protein